MTSPAVLSHRVSYLRLRTMRVPPNSMTLLALAKLPIYVRNAKRTNFFEIRTVSDVTECTMHQCHQCVIKERCTAQLGQ